MLIIIKEFFKRKERTNKIEREKKKERERERGKLNKMIDSKLSSYNQRLKLKINKTK